MLKPLNTVPLQQFIQQVKSAELSNQREIKIDVKTAKNLVYCMAELEARLLEKNDKIIEELAKSGGTEEITIKMDGGGFEI